MYVLKLFTVDAYILKSMMNSKKILNYFYVFVYFVFLYVMVHNYFKYYNIKIHYIRIYLISYIAHRSTEINIETRMWKIILDHTLDRLHIIVHFNSLCV